MLPIFNQATRRVAVASATSLLSRPTSSFPGLISHLAPPASLFALTTPSLSWPVRFFSSASAAPLRSAFSSPDADSFDASTAPSFSFTPSPSITPSPTPPLKSPASSSTPSSPSSADPLNPASYPMDPQLRASLTKNFSITSFFPIQAECYLPITEGRDLIGRSKTGTGKTLAFILPLLQRLRAQRMQPGPRGMSVIVLEPTRELARQVAGEIQKLSRDVKLAVVYGGVGYGEQVASLRDGVDICVGTPGRLMDLLDRGSCSTRTTQMLVLDEADEMLKRGFKKEIDTLLSEVNKRKKAQVLLFSATLPDWVRQVSEEFQKDAVVVDKVSGEDNVTPTRIDHLAMPSPRGIDERMQLIGQLVKEAAGRVIVFVNRKADADLLCSREFYQALGQRAGPLHGDLSQAQRDALIYDFKSGKLRIMVNTHSTHTGRRRRRR